MNPLMKSEAFKPDTHTSRTFFGEEGKTEGTGATFHDTAGAIIVIDNRTLARECFVRSVEVSYVHLVVRGFSSEREWQGSPTSGATAAILLNIAARSISDPAVSAEVRHLASSNVPIPVIVLGESEDLREVISAFDCGARGYIPASVGIDVVIEAARLTSFGGGTFLPTASVMSLRDLIGKDEALTSMEIGLTSRQSAVANALRQGKANKIIAYQLKMSESTVKVHIRTIMKKLQATNRTEAAFKLNLLQKSRANAHNV